LGTKTLVVAAGLLYVHVTLIRRIDLNRRTEDRVDVELLFHASTHLRPSIQQCDENVSRGPNLF
jgi:hypothetical protein